MSRPNDIDLLLGALGAALELQTLAEVRQRLFDLSKIPDQLFRVHVERVPGAALQCRASLKLTDAGRHLLAALRAGEVNPLIVKEALGHFDFSCVRKPGEDGESLAEATPVRTAAPEARP